ncbi:MAG: ABC transporter ATP-binding protein [Pseudomonadota bacterium]
MSFLHISNLCKSYGASQILSDINLAVEEGEFLVLVGPSGCGKSTLLGAIAGLETIESGSIVINGRDVGGIHPSRRNIAMVFQSYALYPNMTVAGNITFGMEMHKVPKPEREQALHEVARLLQIDHLLTRKPAQLSGGQRQRVAIGRALVRKPDVFLFDEPLSNLDTKLRVEMRTELKKLHQRLQTTIVYVTHDQIEAMTLSSRIAVLYQGRVQQFGTPRQIYDQPENLFVASFMGSPAMNLIPARISSSNGIVFAEIENADGSPSRLQLLQANVQDRSGEEVMLGIRPESITDFDSADRKSAKIERLQGRVTIVEPAGSDTFATMMLAGRDVVARIRADSAISPGDAFDFAVNMDKVVLFDPKTELRIQP